MNLGPACTRVSGRGVPPMTCPATAQQVQSYEQVRHPAVERLGRAIRTAAADQLFYLGAAAESDAEARRLKDLHRDVRGVGPDGQRYSALNPETWNWILYSTF